MAGGAWARFNSERTRGEDGAAPRHYLRSWRNAERDDRMYLWPGGVPVVTGRQIGLQASGGKGSAKYAGGAGVMTGWYSAPHSRCRLEGGVAGPEGPAL